MTTSLQPTRSDAPASASMKKRRFGKFALGAFLILSILGLGAGVFAQRFAGPWKLFRLVQELELTSEQKTKFIELFKKNRADFKKERPTMEALRDRMIQTLRQERPSKREIDTIVSEWFDHTRRIALSKTDVLLHVHETLTPKQRDTLFKAFEKAQARRKHFIQKRGLDDPNFVPRILK